MTTNIQATYERFRDFCSGPSAMPYIVMPNPVLLFRQTGKALTTQRFFSDVLKAGFVPSPVGTYADHRQIALVLHRSKKRVPREGHLPPFTIDFRLGPVFEPDLSTHASHPN